MNRRDFLRLLGLGAATAAVVEPVAKKMWFVPSNAPVGSRVERLGMDDALLRAAESQGGVQTVSYPMRRTFGPPQTVTRLDTGESVTFSTTEITFSPPGENGSWFQDTPSPEAYQIRGWDPAYGPDYSVISEVDVKNGRLSVRKVTAADLKGKPLSGRSSDGEWFSEGHYPEPAESPIMQKLYAEVGQPNAMHKYVAERMYGGARAWGKSGSAAIANSIEDLLRKLT